MYFSAETEVSNLASAEVRHKLLKYVESEKSFA